MRTQSPRDQSLTATRLLRTDFYLACEAGLRLGGRARLRFVNAPADTTAIVSEFSKRGICYMNEKQIYADRLRAWFDRMSVEIETLDTAAEAVEPEQSRLAEDKIIELRARKSLLREKLEALEAANDEAWLEYRAGAEAAADSLNFALCSIRTHF